MIVHQNKGVQLPVVRFHCPHQPLEPSPAIPIVGHDIAPLDPTGHDMIEGPFIPNTQWSRYGPKRNRAQTLTQD